MFVTFVALLCLGPLCQEEIVTDSSLDSNLIPAFEEIGSSS